MGYLMDILQKDKVIMNIIRLILLLVILVLLVIIIIKGASVGNLVFLSVVILALIFGYDLKGVLKRGNKTKNE